MRMGSWFRAVSDDQGDRRHDRRHRLCQNEAHPYLGLCLGMQLVMVEFARHVLGFADAHSVEFDPATTHPVIALMPDQNGVEDIGGPCALAPVPAGWRRIPWHTVSTERKTSPNATGTAMR